MRSWLPSIPELTAWFLPHGQRERPLPAVAVFQGHGVLLAADYRSAELARGVLDDHPQLHGMLGRSGLAPTGGQDIGSVAIHHAAILGSPAPKLVYGAPTRRGTRTWVTRCGVCAATLIAACRTRMEGFRNCVALTSW
jgi:hypothetical protein